MLRHDHIAWMGVWRRIWGRIEELLWMRIGRGDLRRWAHAVVSLGVVGRADSERVGGRSVVVSCGWKVGVVGRTL